MASEAGKRNRGGRGELHGGFGKLLWQKEEGEGKGNFEFIKFF